MVQKKDGDSTQNRDETALILLFDKAQQDSVYRIEVLFECCLGDLLSRVRVRVLVLSLLVVSE